MSAELNVLTDTLVSLNTSAEQSLIGPCISCRDCRLLMSLRFPLHAAFVPSFLTKRFSAFRQQDQAISQVYLTCPSCHDAPCLFISSNNKWLKRKDLFFFIIIFFLKQTKTISHLDVQDIYTHPFKTWNQMQTKLMYEVTLQPFSVFVLCSASVSSGKSLFLYSVMWNVKYRATNKPFEMICSHPLILLWCI